MTRLSDEDVGGERSWCPMCTSELSLDDQGLHTCRTCGWHEGDDLDEEGLTDPEPERLEPFNDGPLLLIATLGSLLVVSSAWAADPNLPNLALTPGVATPLTAQQICATKWGKDPRHVTAAMKAKVEQAYGRHAKDCPSGKLEIDHLISRELGGADATRNLWPQCYEPRASADFGAHKKDRLENRLHVEVCQGQTTLEEAQKEIVEDWIKAYQRRFGR